jgi:hypothetical protein
MRLIPERAASVALTATLFPPKAACPLKRNLVPHRKDNRGLQTLSDREKACSSYNLLAHAYLS